MAADDWNMFLRSSVAPELGSPTVIERPVAEMIPLVTVSGPGSPRAFPMATTGSPTVIEFELPTETVSKLGPPFSCSNATSDWRSVPSTTALYALPLPSTCAVTSVEPSITWLLVSTTPEAVRTIPVPWSWPLEPLAVMSTVAGSTRAAIEWTLRAWGFDDRGARRPEAGRAVDRDGDVPLLVRANAIPAPAPPATRAVAINTAAAGQRRRPRPRFGPDDGGPTGDMPSCQVSPCQESPRQVSSWSGGPAPGALQTVVPPGALSAGANSTAGWSPGAGTPAPPEAGQAWAGPGHCGPGPAARSSQPLVPWPAAVGKTGGS